MYRFYVKGNMFFLEKDGVFLVETGRGNVDIKKYGASSTKYRVVVIDEPNATTKLINYSQITGENGVNYATQADFDTFIQENTGKSSPSDSGGSTVGVTILRWLATSETGANVVIPQDTPTLIPLNAQPFNEFNIDSKLSLDLVNNWVYFTGISDNAWITVRATYQGITGDADMTPSIRFYNDKTNLSVFDEVHGQTSKQKNTKTSSYLAEGFKGSAEVMQIYLETDKDETVSFRSLSIKIEDVLS